eukprot:Skav205740  [mRNA]  locus=scaffold1496:273949:279816:+ [translate_table: standard]
MHIRDADGEKSPLVLIGVAVIEAVHDRKVAAMLLRSARTKVEEAEEKGLTAALPCFLCGQGLLSPAYLEEEAYLDKTVNKRLLNGEVSQARSFNRRAGVEPLPAVVPETAPLTLKEREAKALELEYVRSSHRMRGSGLAAEKVAAQPLRKKQRVGTQGEVLDLAALEKEARRQADEDAAMVNPILQPPPKLTKRIAVKINR